MKLFYFAPSHHSRRVLAVIHHLGLEVELEHRDLPSGQHRTPDIQALSPNGMLPLLVDGDVVVAESNAIMQYLADRQGATPLYPAAPAARAKVNQWLSWQMCHFGPASSPFVFEHIVKPLLGLGAPDAARLAKTSADFIKFGSALDKQLAANTFVTGSEPTLADYAIASNLMYAGPAHMPLADLPRVQSWMNRIEALPAWRASAPPAH